MGRLFCKSFRPVFPLFFRSLSLFCIFLSRVVVVSGVSNVTFWNSFSDFSTSFFFSMLTNPCPLSKGVTVRLVQYSP